MTQAFPNAETELVGVVGHPIRHSLSPAVWNPAMRDVGRNAVFLAFDVLPEDFSLFIQGMRAAGARGFNVTVPHKLAAFEIATKRTEPAEATGALNVLVFRDSEILGSNTDVYGVREAVGELGVDAERVLVIGAGGAGRAAAYAMRDADVWVANRTAGKVRGDVVDWDDVPNAIGGFDLVIQTTTVGMDGESSVLDADALAKAAKQKLKAVLDVVYRPDETPLVKAARSAGLIAADGLAMLVHQAGAAYELIFDAPPPLQRMREATWQYAGRPPEPKDYRGAKPLI